MQISFAHTYNWLLGGLGGVGGGVRAPLAPLHVSVSSTPEQIIA
jgi:hypothetical protein